MRPFFYSPRDRRIFCRIVHAIFCFSWVISCERDFASLTEEIIVFLIGLSVVQ